ncbi:flagellar protein FlaG [Hydrogenophilus thermoluteolus]|nr:flagellar protein FlaG [Hydrogenophilus thermoluteolus]MBW7657089.1 flagellar protein FlaG [Hydrogenophilus thermoluteolus]
MSTTPTVSLPQQSATQIVRDVTPPPAVRATETERNLQQNRATSGTERPTPPQEATNAATQQATAPQPNAPLDERTVEDAVRKVQKTVSALNSALQFQIDKDTEKLVIKIVDTNTKEVIKQIPPQEILEIAKALDKLQGLLVREKA